MRKILSILLTGVMVILLLCSGSFGIVYYVCNFKIPEINFDEHVTAFDLEADATPDDIVALAEGNIRRIASPMIRIGPPRFLLHNYRRVGDTDLYNVIVTIGVEPTIRCSGLHTPVAFVDFYYDPETGIVRARTYVLDGGTTIPPDA
jgi:hypothetical protein